MEQFELIAPCHFGLEAVLKREILDLGYEIQKVEVMDYEFLKSLIEKSLFLVMHKPSAALIYFYVQQSEFCLKLEAFMPQHLMSCLNRQRHFRGNIISRKMVVSG